MMRREHFGPFVIDEDSCDEHNIYVEVPSKQLTVAIKLDDEGIVIDVYPLLNASQPAATLGVTYEEVREISEDL